MATATKNPEKVIVPAVVAPGTTTLELSKEEAEMLVTVLGMVGGSEERSPRKHADAVFYALREAGVPWYGLGATGVIRFESARITNVDRYDPTGFDVEVIE